MITADSTNQSDEDVMRLDNSQKTRQIVAHSNHPSTTTGTEAAIRQALGKRLMPGGDSTMVLRLFSKSSTDSKSSNSSDSESNSGSSSARSDIDLTGSAPEELARAARQAQSSKERQAIISHINDVQTLQTLAEASGCLAPCADQLASIDSIDTALSLVLNLANNGDITAQIELAMSTHNNELRAAQINQFTTEEDLVALEHASRSKNKACNRLARARLDTLRQARVTASEAAAQTQEFAANAERLENDAHLNARFEALAQKHASAVEAHAVSVAVLKEFKEHAPALVDMPRPPQQPDLENADAGPDFAGLSQSFSQLQKQLEDGTKAEKLTEAMNKASAEWQVAIAQATPDVKSIDAVTQSSALYEAVRNNEALLTEREPAMEELLAQTPELATTDIAGLKRNELPSVWIARSTAVEQTKQIASLTKGINYPKNVTPPAVIALLAQRKQVLSDLLDACKTLQTKIEKDFSEQVKHLNNALEAGELKRAEAARGEARSLQDALPPGAANNSRKRFGALLSNMQNLRDWQHFATDPKREELCAQMQSIADNPKHPDEQADLVKNLRAQWNALGGKGPKEIAEKFDEAAARAFEPCRLHYAKLTEKRGENLATRKKILDQIEEFVSTTDWANADLNGARTILNSARKEWRDAFPVERSANKKLEKRFQTATDTLYSKLQDGWGENLAAKEQLVTSAESLLTSEDPLPERLDAAKKLQQRWKQAGPVPRGPDQKLWKRFRTACDALFNTRDEERSANQARYAADQTAANQRLDAFEQAIANTEAKALERSLLNTVKSDLDEFEHLDRDVIKRARRLEETFTAKLAQKAAAAKAQKLSDLKTLDIKAAASELAGESVSDEVKAQNSSFSSRTEAEANAHLDLVLEAETEAGIESPASNSQRRLELQVERLNAGMNSGARSTKNAMELASQWCALKATPESEALRSRLFAAAEVLLAGKPT